MAMLNAGLPMKYLVAAITAAILSDGTICTDPTAKQEQVEYLKTSEYVLQMSATKIDNVSILIPNYDFPLHNVVARH